MNPKFKEISDFFGRFDFIIRSESKSNMKLYEIKF